MLNAGIVIVTAAVVIGLFHPRMIDRTWWRATITPLASIIGSGFLVLGPILDSEYGWAAPLVMAALCLGTYALGATIRYNIAAIDSEASRPRREEALDRLSEWALAFAYVISVAYYLNLLGAFGVSMTPVDDRLHARLVTSAVLVLILFMGWTRGFSALERMEQVSVSIKLAIIAGLLVGLGAYVWTTAEGGDLVLNPLRTTGWSAVALGFGLIVTVQGFEISRYMGDSYDAPTRIRTMKYAQWISGAIYIIYITLFAYVFERGELELTETAIIDMMNIVAPILPVLLVAAALSAQFSAAVADTGGCGGLVAENSGGRLSHRTAYLGLAAIVLGLTWFAEVFEIIAYASRAFAAYYALQAALCAAAARRRGDRAVAAGAAAMAALALAVTLFGRPVEAGG